MVLCLTAQCFPRQTQRPIKYGEDPSFVLQICIGDYSFKIEMVFKEYNSLEFSGINFCYTFNRM